MSNKLKQIAAILANHDVRDPRATLRAAEECEECQCQPLSELFKQFEEAALKGRRKEDRA